MSGVNNSLNELFQKHRLVFWYDPEGEMREEFDGYPLDDGDKVEVDNNEFGLKHRMAREEPKKRFLVYLPYTRPSYADNWFLDLELAHHVFTADQTSLILQEMGWLEEHRAFVEEFAAFFNSKDRRERLREKLHEDDDERIWKLKMASVFAREEANVESLLFSLLAELANEAEKKWKEIEKFGLVKFLWDEVARSYDYRPEEPSLLDFAIEAFLAAAPCGKDAKLGRDAQVFLKRWKDNARYAEDFEKLSARLEKDLKIEQALCEIDGHAPLKGQDAFEAIERKVIVELRNGLLQGALRGDALRKLLDQREGSYWHKKYKHLYEAFRAAGNLLEGIQLVDLSFTDPKQAIENYAKTYHEIDRHYRLYGYHASLGKQATLLDELTEEIERRYSNQYLLQLNDRFQSFLDEEKGWPIKELDYQRDFYDNHVLPFAQKGVKVFVIISDALRYEAANELHERILKEDKFKSKIDYQLGVLPSYTQLGMAALLPHKELEVKPATAEVLADGKRTMGLVARAKILAECGYRATAVKANDFIAMNAKEKGRELSGNHDVIYIYHNGIDAVGDKSETEVKTFEAVEQEFETLLTILKKVASVNGTHALITADHGFLFRREAIDESDFSANPKGKEVGTVNRRFSIAEEFEESPGAKIFRAEDLGLQGEAEFAIAKSINRFRVKGAGSRFVHGGASLQEIVLPVLTVSKSRTSDVEQVDVDVLRGTNLISTATAMIGFYQIKPVGEKILKREIRVGFQSKSGESISEVHDLSFDSMEEDPRSRERKISFNFGKAADACTGQDIFLILEERIPSSAHYREYKRETYRFKKTFETDFEL